MGTKESRGNENTMKVLYLGHYRENTGWANGAIHHMLALKSVGVDVVARNIALTPTISDVPDDIKKMESKSLQDIDYCIQHILPFHVVGTSKFKKNVLFMPFESTIKSNNSFLLYAKELDELWVPNNYNQDMLRNANVESKVIPYAFDLPEYKKDHKALDFKSSNNKFKFYFIGGTDHRKNIRGILKSYLSEFTIADPVTFMLKLTDPHRDAVEMKNEFIQKIDALKDNLRMHSQREHYPEINIITEQLPSELIQSLHKTCDCYVGPSHGEGWSISAFEAMCYGNTPICSKEGGPVDFIDKDNKNTGFLVSGSYGVCDHANPAFDHIFTGNDLWFLPDELEIKRAMRCYYENRDSIDRNDGIKAAKQYDYETVGNRIKEALNA